MLRDPLLVINIIIIIIIIIKTYDLTTPRNRNHVNRNPFWNLPQFLYYK